VHTPTHNGKDCNTPGQTKQQVQQHKITNPLKNTEIQRINPRIMTYDKRAVFKSFVSGLHVWLIGGCCLGTFHDILQRFLLKALDFLCFCKLKCTVYPQNLTSQILGHQQRLHMTLISYDFMAYGHMATCDIST
jgi:hypothetical protein